MKQFLQTFMIFFTSFAFAQDCSDLFISEYIEGPGNNNGLEIYNPTNSSIDLSDYTINRYGNGAISSPDVWALTGSIASGEAITIGNGQLDSIWVSTYWSLPVDPVFYAACNLHCSGIYPTPFYFNGDDALTLEKVGTNGSGNNGYDIVDIFGKVGEDPGLAWTDDVTAGFTDANGGTWWTKRQTLVRKSTVKKGKTLNPIVFNPTLEWDSLPDATYSQMGSHNCDCIGSTSIEEKGTTFVLYPNPVSQGDYLTFNSKQIIKQISIFNILGKKERNIIINRKNINFSTSDFPQGVYLFQILFENGKIENSRLIID
ncbi:MAG: lamin tail domain-containing protein [Bacteroidota bacterium]|nr:lamin tail domain-containing protein [Bacteroidota bacterium]